MDFRRCQTISAFFRLDHHPVSDLRRAFRTAQIAHLVLRFVRETNGDDLAFRGFDLHMGGIDGGHDAEHMLTTAMGGHESRGTDEEECDDEEAKECHGKILSLKH